jgi:polar amino acid transport system ATP-binding protein
MNTSNDAALTMLREAAADGTASAPSATAAASGNTARPATDTVLHLNGISKSFGENHVLRDVSLTVHKGETVCLLGPSGCGKSTLLRCVNWLEIPDAGTVHVSNRRMGVREGSSIKMSDAELARSRARIGMVFQHFALWPHLTVLQNVMEAPLHVLGRPRDEARADAERLLERVGLAGKMEAFPSRLSGGQKQRVGIARALAMKPDILLFDEPTSALDPMLVGEVLNVMRSLAQEGATMVIVTHEMEFARQVASRIVFMDAGQVIESAPPEQFFGAPQTPRARQFLARFRSPHQPFDDTAGDAPKLL